jgi:hypothetical protein
MAEYDIDRTAATEAAALLRNLLQTEVPTGDFTEGSAVSDILIDGHAIIAGYLTKQIQVIRDRQSLLTLQNLPDSESVSDAADAILDNFFRTRAQGRFAKGAVTLHFVTRQDVVIPRNTRFFKTTALVFYIDNSTDLLLQASDMRPEIGSDGTVKSYSTTVFLTAARVGADYNIAPGRFVSFDRFSSLLSFVENLSSFAGGDTVQSTESFIQRSTNAIALRALINARSNDATMLERFADVESTTTVGYGDPEMARDVVENVSNTVKLHAGGHMDIYVRQAVQEAVDQIDINTLQLRNDDLINILRHTAHLTTFPAANVQVGDILVITQGLPEAPFQYKITAVRNDEVEVASRTPFSIATDETGAAIAYTIGNNYPNYDNKVKVPPPPSTTPTTDAQTSRQFSELNSVQLAPVPVYRIKKVELIPSGAVTPPELNGYLDPLTGNVSFTARKNKPIMTAPAPGAELGYFVYLKNPTESQSSRAVAMLQVGWPALDLTGLTLEITYETPVNFATVHSYVIDRFNRPSCSNTLARAPHPIYLYASIPYRARTTPINSLQTVVPTFDAVQAQADLTAYVNNYRETEPLDVSLLATKARETSAAVASIYNFTLSYQLIVPDGRVMNFETEDKITIFPEGGTSSTARMLNPTDFGLPATDYYAQLRKLLADQGISDRVTRYRVSEDGIVFDQRS